MQAKALTIAAFGARGSGKTAYVKQHLAQARPDRLLVWDHKHDPSLADLGKAYKGQKAWALFVKAAQLAHFSLRYLPDHELDINKQFSAFCQLAWHAGNLTMFVDELPEVTKANRAPPMWRKCVNVGRSYSLWNGNHSALSIIGAGQRAAECDKSFTGNADVVHCGRLANTMDAKAMAVLLGCKEQELMQLPDLHWIERHAGRIDPVRGVLSFAKKRQIKK
jgi:hypothetical protein